MTYSAKDYSNLIGMDGFSETLLKNHFSLYQGYRTNTNKLMDSLASMLKEGKVGTPEYAELKRADYIVAFFKDINWSVAESRLKQASSM